MRSIKFRIWDKKHEAWATEPYYAIGLDGSIRLGAHHSVEPDRYVLQQFTGLVDSKGKEIYEGDIISQGNPRFLHRVIWSDSHARWSLLSCFLIRGGRHAFHGLMSHSEKHEIVGNIYDNPELWRRDE